MKEVFHLYKKEVQYLKLRWLLWLGVLLFELAVNAGWLVKLGDYDHAALAYLPWITWLFAAWLAASYSPEDKPFTGSGFFRARPLKSSSYWISRVVAFCTLIMMPLAIQEAVYLTVSGRPWSSIMEGLIWKSWIGIAALSWLIPMTAWFNHFRLIMALGVCYASGYVGFQAAKWLLSDFISATWAMDIMRWPVVWNVLLIYGVCVAALIYGSRSKKEQWGLITKLVIVGLLALASPVLAMYWSVRTQSVTQTDQAKAEVAAKRTAIEPRLYTLQAASKNFRSKRRSVSLETDVIVQDKGIGFYTRPHPDTATPEKNPHAFKIEPRRFFWEYFSSSTTDQGIASLFPPNTLFANEWNNNRFISLLLPQKFDRDKPLSLSKNFDLKWIEWSSPLNTALKQGTIACTLRSRWKILKVLTDVDAAGKNSPGTITINLEVEWDANEKDTNPGGLHLALYSPERKMAWCQESA